MPEPAVGKRILIRNRTPEAEWVEVVGVVGHQHDTSLATPGREQVYFTDAFVGSGRVLTWAIRTGSDAASYENRVRALIKEIDPSLVVTEMEPMEAVAHDAQASTRFSLLLIVVFAGHRRSRPLACMARFLPRCGSARLRSGCAWPWEQDERTFSSWWSARDCF